MNPSFTPASGPHQGPPNKKVLNWVPPSLVPAQNWKLGGRYERVPKTGPDPPTVIGQLREVKGQLLETRGRDLGRGTRNQWGSEARSRAVKEQRGEIADPLPGSPGRQEVDSGPKFPCSSSSCPSPYDLALSSSLFPSPSAEGEGFLAPPGVPGKRTPVGSRFPEWRPHHSDHLGSCWHMVHWSYVLKPGLTQPWDLGSR